MKFVGRLFSILLMIAGLGFIVIYIGSVIQSLIATAWIDIIWMLLVGIAMLAIGIVLAIISFKKKPNDVKVSPDELILAQLEKDFNNRDVKAILRHAVMHNDREDLEFLHYQKAAELGSKEAKYHVGFCYFYGKGTTKDEKLGFKYIKEAADKGYESAIKMVGECYKDGRGVTRNKTKAEQYLKSSASKDDVFSMVDLARMYKEKAEKSDTDSNEWYKKAFDLFKKAADKDYSTALYEVGVFYRFGYGVTKSEKNAMGYFKKASKKGNCQSSVYCAQDAEKTYNKTKKLSDLEATCYYYDLAVRQGADTSVYNKYCEIKNKLDALKPRAVVSNSNSNTGHNKSSSTSKTSSNKSSYSSSDSIANTGPSQDRFFMFVGAKITTTKDFLRMEYIGDTPMYAHVNLNVTINFKYENCDGRTHTITEYTTVRDVFDTETYSEYDLKNQYPDRYFKGFLANKDYKSYFQIEKWL